MSELLAPLTPPDCDLRGSEWMGLYGARLFSSDFDARANDAEFRAAVRLWWEAWQQVPAGSLPNDEIVLCRLAGLGRDLKGWRKSRAMAMYGFILCSDGRFYHPFICEQALKAQKCRENARLEREAATERMRKWRASQNGEHQPSTSGPPRHVTRHKPNGDSSHTPPVTHHKPPSDASQSRPVTVTEPSRDGLKTVQDRTVPEEELKKEDKLNSCFSSSSDSCARGEMGRNGEAEAPAEVTHTPPDAVGAAATAPYIRAVAKAHAMPVPYGPYRDRGAQLNALGPQPEVEEDGRPWAPPIGRRLEPCDPIRSVEEQIAWCLAEAAKERERRAPARELMAAD